MTPEQRAKVEELIPRPADKSPEWCHGFDWAVDMDDRDDTFAYREKHGIPLNNRLEDDDFDEGVDYAQSHHNYYRIEEAFR
jgi:hypothetical protein